MLLRKMSKFSANINFLFAENNSTLLERFRLAKAAGFRAIESPLPNDLKLDDVVKVQKETRLDVVLLNMTSGTVPAGQFGCAAFPDHVTDFNENLSTTIQFAKALNCKKIHLVAGKLSTPPQQIHHDTYLQNLRHAIKLLEQANMIGVIEPICKYGVPGYYLNNFDEAVKIVKQLNSPNLKLMFDLYHVQHLTGNLTVNLKDLMPIIGHIQIAQVPDRNEPNTPGELNYDYLFKTILEAGYTDWLGCEYKPKTNSVDGLKSWLKEFNLSL